MKPLPRRDQGLLPEDLVRSLQLANLTLEFLEPRALVRRQAHTPTRITLCLTQPLTHVSDVHSIFGAIDVIAAHCESC